MREFFTRSPLRRRGTPRAAGLVPALGLLRRLDALDGDLPSFAIAGRAAFDTPARPAPRVLAFVTKRGEVFPLALGTSLATRRAVALFETGARGDAPAPMIIATRA
jgi:hypothetical protein